MENQDDLDALKCRVRKENTIKCDTCLGEGEYRYWDGNGELAVDTCNRCKGCGIISLNI